MRQKDGLDIKFNFGSLREDKKLNDKVKRAKKFFDNADFCKYHELKSTSNLIYQKLYWCNKVNKNCNLANCPLLKHKL